MPNGRLPEEAKRLWRALAPYLVDLGVMKVTDEPAFEMLCLHYAVARAALDELWGEDGSIKVTALTSFGDEKKHPAASVLRENSMAFKGYLAEFGLTPSSRVRIKAEPGRELSLAEMLFEGLPDGEPDE